MRRELQGHYVTISTVGEKAQAFVPAPLGSGDTILNYRQSIVCLIGFSGNDKIGHVDAQETEMALFRKHERTDRPTGDDAFIEKLERLLDRRLKLKNQAQR
jgi:hypothetical protein